MKGILEPARKNFRFRHLTNDAVQKHGASYGKNESGNKLSYIQFQRYLDKIGFHTNFLEYSLPKIRQIILDSILATYKKMNPEKKEVFEILGYDFMLDEDLRPFLIEANTNPCLELSSAYLSALIPAMIENALHIVLDPIFPSPRAVTRKLGVNKFELIFHEMEAMPYQFLPFQHQRNMEFEYSSKQKPRLYAHHKANTGVPQIFEVEYQPNPDFYQNKKSIESSLQDSVIIHKSVEEGDEEMYSGFSITKILGDENQKQEPGFNKLLDFNSLLPPVPQNATHKRRTSHRRQQSMHFHPNTPNEDIFEHLRSKSNLKEIQRQPKKKTVSFCSQIEDLGHKYQPSVPSTHVRTISDSDSVVYCVSNEVSEMRISISDYGEVTGKNSTACSTLQNGGERGKEYFCQNYFEYEQERAEITGKQHLTDDSEVRRSLPILGELQTLYRPTSCYCDKCDMEVHTKIDYSSEGKIQGTIFKWISQVCCQMPVWIKKRSVHRCSKCNKILARS